MNFRDTFLLTGAGFTSNFGGLLARDMWAKIFSNPKLKDAGNIKLKLRENFDFEEIYSDVFDSRSKINAGEIKIFEDVVNETYLFMDNIIQSSWDSLSIHHSDIRKFLDSFAEKDGKSGVCFTLNQDLMLEKRFGWQPLVPPSMKYSGNFGSLDANDLDSTIPKMLPADDELDTYKSQAVSQTFCYIKLHGSLKWISSDGHDSKIIGINKMQAITKIPLLRWYFDLFKEAISQQNAKLVVIGYDFGDSHINSLIADAYEKNNLRLFIISPEDPESLTKRLKYKGQGQLLDAHPIGTKIWNSIDGYFKYKLSEIFPRNQNTKNPELDEILKSLEFS